MGLAGRKLIQLGLIASVEVALGNTGSSPRAPREDGAGVGC